MVGQVGTPRSKLRDLGRKQANGSVADTKSCWVLYNGSMGRHLVLVAHLNAHDVERRYRTAKQAVERTWWQIVWLVSQGQTATEIARSTGVTRGWIGQVVKRSNTLGPAGLYDRRRTHARRQPLALSEEQQTEVLAVLQGPPPHRERWTGRLVAGGMSRRLGRPIPRPLGWVSLVRLKGQRWGPRPRPVLADAEQQAAFKKRSARSSRPSPPPSRGRRSSSGRPTSTASASRPSSRRSGASADGGPGRPPSTAMSGAPASALSIPPRAGPCGTWLPASPSPSSRSSWLPAPVRSARGRPSRSCSSWSALAGTRVRRCRSPSISTGSSCPPAPRNSSPPTPSGRSATPPPSTAPSRRPPNWKPSQRSGASSPKAGPPSSAPPPASL